MLARNTTIIKERMRSSEKMDLKLSNVKELMEYGESVNKIINRVTTEIAEHGNYNCALIESLTMQLKILEERLPASYTNAEPYINGEYNPEYGDNRLCKCGHTYDRHFDSYDDMYPVGCKYCACSKFEEMTWADLSIYAKNVLEWSENVINDNHDIMEIMVGQYFDRPSFGKKGTTHILITRELFNEISAWCLSDKNYIVIDRQSDYLKFVLRYKHEVKVGDKVEFVQIGMSQLLHGRVIAVNESSVEVKCKNGCHRYPDKNKIIRIM